MSEVTVEQLQLKIETESQSASNGIDSLISSLNNLKKVASANNGLSNTAKQIAAISSGLKGLNNDAIVKIRDLGNALGSLSKVKDVKISSSISNQISKIGSALSEFNSSQLSKIKDFSEAIKPLSSVSGKGLSSVVNALSKLPSITKNIDSDSISDFATKIKQITASITPLAQKLQTVNLGFANLSNAAKNTSSNTRNVSQSVNVSNLNFATMAIKVKTLVSSMMNLGSVISKWIDQSNSYVENLNLFNVTMGQYAEGALEYANTVSEVMGIDPSEWMRNQGVFMSLATGFGVASDRAAIMSKNLTQLGYDIASFYDSSYEEAFQKLQSGLAGELEPLRRIGYDLSVARLQQEAWNLGITKSVNAMTQAEKAQLRYYAIMTQVTHVQGDMARTLESPANQLRIFQAQLSMTARSLGNLFIPALNKVLPYAIAFVKVLRTVADAIANIFGFKLPEMDFSSVSTSGIDAATDSANDLNNGIGTAAESAKKLKKTLMGFDELNIIPSQDSNSGGGASGAGTAVGGVGGGLDFELPQYDFLGDAVSSKVNELTNKILEWLGLTKEISTWTDLLDTNFGRILTTVIAIGLSIAGWKLSQSLLNGIGQLMGLKNIPGGQWVSLGISLSIAGIVIEGAGIMDAIANGVDFTNIVEMVGGSTLIISGGAAIGKFLGQGIMGGAIAGIVAGIPMLAAGIYDAVTNGLTLENGALIDFASTMIGAGIGFLVGGPVGAAIGAGIGFIVGLIIDGIIWVVQNFDLIKEKALEIWGKISEFFGNIWDKVQSFFEPAITFISSKVSQIWEKIKSIFTPAIEWFSKLFGSVFDTVSDVFHNIGVIASGCWELIKLAWGAIGDWFKGKLDAVKDFFSAMWKGVKDEAGRAWEGIKEFFSPAVEWFSNLFGKAWAGIRKIFEVGGELFVDIKDGVVSGFKFIVNSLIKGINKVISIPFSGVNAALRFVKNIEIVGIKPFKSLREISVPQIPLLATGGFPDNGQMFIARESGPELVGQIGGKNAVVNNEQIIKGIEEGVKKAMRESSRSGGEIVVNAVFELDGETVAKKVIKVHNNIARQTGASPLMI